MDIRDFTELGAGQVTGVCLACHDEDPHGAHSRGGGPEVAQTEIRSWGWTRGGGLGAHSWAPQDRHPGKSLAVNPTPLPGSAKANGTCGTTEGRVHNLYSDLEELG